MDDNNGDNCILYLKITFTQTNLDLERYWQSVYLKSIDQFEQK